MKILMSLSELTALVIKTYNLPEAAELEVTAHFHTDALKLEAAFYREGFINKDTQDIRPEQKIAAIKKLRELVAAVSTNGCGLAMAKYAVEDWKRFFAYVSKRGYPDMNGSGATPWVE